MLSSIYFMYPISVDRRKRECFPEKILVIKTVLNWVPLFSFFFGFHSLFSLLLREDVIFYGGLTKIERNWRLSIKPREDFAMGTTYNMFSQCLPHLGIDSCLKELHGKAAVLLQVVSPTPENCLQSWWLLQFTLPLQSADQVWGSLQAVSAILLLGAGDTTAWLSFQRALCHMLVLLGL